MGQKVHPYGFRLGFNKPWRSRWFAKQGYAKLLQEDLELKDNLRDRLKSAGVQAVYGNAVYASLTPGRLYAFKIGNTGEFCVEPVPAP